MNRRRLILGVILLVSVLTAFACGDDGGDEFAFGLDAETLVTDGMADNVSAIAFAPDGRAFFAEQYKGTIRIVNADGTLQPEPFTQIVVADWLGQDWGLTGLALDPDFEENHYVYAFYTEYVRTVTYQPPEGDPQEHDIGQPKLVRFTEENGRSEDLTLISDDFPETADATPGYNANGELHFGPDGFLYASVGDYDLYELDRDMVTDLSTPIGKVLRMQKDGSPAPDNPFIDEEGADPRIFAYGFREPFPFAFGPDGTLYGTDNTTVSCEELNVIEAGAYYGWPEMGSFPFDDCEAAPGTQPIHRFSREGLEPNAFISFVEASGLSYLSDSPYARLSESLIVCESQKSATPEGEVTNGVLRRLVLDGPTVSSSEVIVESCFGDVRVSPGGVVYYATRTELKRLLDSDGTAAAPAP